MEILDKAVDFLNDLGAKIVEYLLSWLYQLPDFFQGLMVVVIAILTLIGTITLIKKSAKLIITLGTLVIVAILVYIFVIKK